MSIPQIPVVSTLRERVVAAVEANAALEDRRLADRDLHQRRMRAADERRLIETLREILGVELAEDETFDWSGGYATVTIERVAFCQGSRIGGINRLRAWHPTERDWVTIAHLHDLGPILAALDAAEARS